MHGTQVSTLCDSAVARKGSVQPAKPAAGQTGGVAGHSGQAVELSRLPNVVDHVAAGHTAPLTHRRASSVAAP